MAIQFDSRIDAARRLAQFYREFPQVEDEEVVAVLAQRAKKHAASEP